MDIAGRRTPGSSRPVLVTAIGAGAVFAVVSVLRDYLYFVFSADFYLPLHSLVEVASVVVSFSIFALYWNASRERRDAQAAFIGAGFLAVAILDSLHTLSFPGMPDFITPSSVDKGIWYFLSARLWAATVLLAAAMIPPGSRAWVLGRWPLLTVNLAVAAAVFVLVSFFPSWLPAMFVPGTGLTPLKIGLEYLVVIVSGLAAMLYFRSYQVSGNSFFQLLAAAMMLTAFSELFFTLYTTAYDIYNLLGHLYKVLAYYLIFNALFVYGVQRPYRELQTLYDQIENQLKRTINQLESSTKSEREAKERAEAAIERLQALQSVTEVALSNLALDELLQELLTRIRGVLSADTAVVLLLSEDGRDLEIRATSGILSSLSERARVPLGEGIAGQVAASRNPVVVDDIPAEERSTQPFQDSVLSLIAVPLITEQRVTGVVQVGTTVPRQFTEDDMRFLQLMADRVATTIERARLYAEMDTTISSMADGVMIFSTSGRLLRGNPVAKSTFGLSMEAGAAELEERLKLVQMETVEGQQLSDREMPVRRALNGETVQGIVTRLRIPGGGSAWISNSAAPIRTSDGRLMGAVVVFSDVTRLRALQEQQEDLLRAVSHDLRTPLTAILGHADLLRRGIQRGDEIDRTLRSADAVMDGARRMNVMIQDLVDSARLESGQMKLQLVPIDIGQFAREVLEGMRGAVGIERVRLEIPEDLPSVSADPHRLERVLVNLLSNALKYSSEDSEVTIRADQRGGEAVVSVVDRGIGIPSEDLDNIFERFYRTAGSHGTHVEGLGLGLYITRKSIEAHGGRIWATSEEGAGSNFSFTLPIAAGEETVGR